jgi:hypothetical protein
VSTEEEFPRGGIQPLKAFGNDPESLHQKGHASGAGRAWSGCGRIFVKEARPFFYTAIKNIFSSVKNPGDRQIF